jgi:putative CocE/NonD family hydrolase
MRVVIENWLRRAIVDVEPPGGASIYVMGANRWLDLESWPPPAKPLRLYLHGEESSEGRLLRQPAEGAVQRLTFDPDDPVPTVGGRGIDPVLPTAGPVDQQAVESRDDVLVYTSDPFPQNVTILGIVTASLRVSAAAASADVAVKLCLVEPRGRSINIVDSIHRDGYEPGRAQRVELALGTTAVEVPRGARLRVQVSGSNFPRFDRNPALVANGVVAELFVHSDATHPSWIEIPLAEAESA